ncbi:N-terminal phage integrase SAM-like domain-containing protein [Nonomuraea africana]|uniref:N-terminal phage integrase SAM-like domain-containing protein n=1 Tax=Nonomuraea africana TaxID=46171 RepID=UPI0021F35E5B
MARWLRCWLEKQHQLRPSTRKAYADHVRLHLIPYLGRIELTELAGRDIARMFAMLAGRLNRYGEPIASSTLHRIRATLRAALNAAVREGLIASNPARVIRLPAHGGAVASGRRWRCGPPSSWPSSSPSRAATGCIRCGS